jgi:hypothetical protein
VMYRGMFEFVAIDPDNQRLRRGEGDYASGHAQRLSPRLSRYL